MNATHRLDGARAAVAELSFVVTLAVAYFLTACSFLALEEGGNYATVLEDTALWISLPIALAVAGWGRRGRHAVRVFVWIFLLMEAFLVVLGWASPLYGPVAAFLIGSPLACAGFQHHLPLGDVGAGCLPRWRRLVGSISLGCFVFGYCGLAWVLAMVLSFVYG